MGRMSVIMRALRFLVRSERRREGRTVEGDEVLDLLDMEIEMDEREGVAILSSFTRPQSEKPPVVEGREKKDGDDDAKG